MRIGQFYASSFLFCLAATVATVAITQSGWRRAGPRGARGRSRHVHTGERINTSYGKMAVTCRRRCDGSIGCCATIHRRGLPDQPQLLDLLTRCSRSCAAAMRFRSSPAIVPPQQRHAGDDDRRCAQNSLHMHDAVDIPRADRSLVKVQRAALSLEAAASVLSPSDFVHIDVGRVRPLVAAAPGD